MPMSPRLLRPRATGFNPKSISGLKLWLDVANTSSLTFNGSTVSQVNDLSGNGFHAAQSTANNQPTYQATGTNGKPTLFFDSTDLLLSSATIADYFRNPTTGPEFTLIAVSFWPTSASGGSFIVGSDAQANGRVLMVSNYGAAGNTIFDIVDASGGRLLFNTATNETVVPHVVTVYRHTSSMAYRVDGAVRASKTDATGNFSATSARLQFGKCDGGVSTSMYLSEAVVYAAALSASDIAKAERGLAKKWGITVA